MPGEIVHFEIPADDTAQGREFWGSLFGWLFEALPGPSEYHMTQVSDQTENAITNMEPGKQGAQLRSGRDQRWRGARERAWRRSERADAGPGMGWFATSRDPQGNEFGLWQNDPSAAPQTA